MPGLFSWAMGSEGPLNALPKDLLGQDGAELHETFFGPPCHMRTELDAGVREQSVKRLTRRRIAEPSNASKDRPSYSRTSKRVRHMALLKAFEEGAAVDNGAPRCVDQNQWPRELSEPCLIHEPLGLSSPWQVRAHHIGFPTKRGPSHGFNVGRGPRDRGDSPHPLCACRRRPHGNPCQPIVRPMQRPFGRSP